MPVGADRKALEARRGELARGLQPGEKSAMARAIIAMFTAYPSVRLDEEGAARTAATYVGQVQAFPLWAVEQACQRLIARNNPFPPSAGELRTAAEGAVKDTRVEFYELRDILDANTFREPDAEEMARRKEMVDRVRDKLHLNKPFDLPRRSITPEKPAAPSPYAETLATEQQALKWLAERAGDPVILPQMSAALRKASGLPDLDEREEAA